jgi:nicotinamidase-related amidase
MKQDNSNTALLVMDMQAGILSRYPAATQLIINVAKAIALARENNIKVIYVVVGFRPGAPERKIKQGGDNPFAKTDMQAFMKIDSNLEPLHDEIIVTKRRISAFIGSDLEVVLRALDIKHLVLTGYATSGVVLSTYCEAADKDYQMTILSNCCGNADEDVHQLLVSKVFPRMASVNTTETWSNLGF